MYIYYKRHKPNKILFGKHPIIGGFRLYLFGLCFDFTRYKRN